jgi:hypothetical protein
VDELSIKETSRGKTRNRYSMKKDMMRKTGET